VRNFISDIKGRILAEGVREQGAEENIFTEEGCKWYEVGEYCIMMSFITCTLC
jgi:uncharacterized Fe-S cluster-containing MiaB family protein